MQRRKIMDNWVIRSSIGFLLLILSSASVIGDQIASNPYAAFTVEVPISTILPTNPPTIDSQTLPLTTIATTTASTTVVPVTTTTTLAPPTTTTPRISTTTTASEPLILNGGLHPHDLAQLLMASGDGYQQVNPQHSQLSFAAPANPTALFDEAQLMERMNEKRSPTGNYNTGSNVPSTIATYGSSVVNIPPVYGATFGQPAAAKGIGYNLGYTAGQTATYGGGNDGGGSAAGGGLGGGLLGGFGRIIQMVGSGIKNLFNLGGGGSSGVSSGGYGQRGGYSGSGGGGLLAGKSIGGAVLGAGLNLKALGLGLGIGAIKGMIIGTKIGLIKGLILGKIKQSLAANAFQQKQNLFSSGGYGASYGGGYDSGYGNTYRQDNANTYDAAYAPPASDQYGSSMAKGDDDVNYGAYAPPSTYDMYGRPMSGYDSYAQLQPPQQQQQGPSTSFGNFALGAVAGAVKGAKDGIVRRIFSGDIFGSNQQNYATTQRSVFSK